MEKICLCYLWIRSERRRILSSMQRDFFRKISNKISPTCVIKSVISFSLYDRWRAQSELHRSYLEAFVRLRNALLRISGTTNNKTVFRALFSLDCH